MAVATHPVPSHAAVAARPIPTPMAVATRPVPNPTAVVVWLDRWHAFVARREQGRRGIVEVGRDADPEPTYLRRVAEVARDCGRVMILGPDEDLVAFDRTYEALFERSDRFVDLEACEWPTSAGLIDRLRFLEGEAEALASALDVPDGDDARDAADAADGLLPVEV